MGFDPALRQIIAGFRNSETWDEELDLRLLQALWPRAAGPALARSTSVIGLSGSRLRVRVPDRTWQTQLGSVRAALLRNINEPWSGPPIRDIRFEYEDYAR
jgi:predicted nucleic acid-binding Zn ribbon protein